MLYREPSQYSEKITAEPLTIINETDYGYGQEILEHLSKMFHTNVKIVNSPKERWNATV